MADPAELVAERYRMDGERDRADWGTVHDPDAFYTRYRALDAEIKRLDRLVVDCPHTRQCFTITLCGDRQQSNRDYRERVAARRARRGF